MRATASAEAPLFRSRMHAFGRARYAVASLLHKVSRARVSAAIRPAPQPGHGKDYRTGVDSIESLGRLGPDCSESLPDARSLHIVRHPCGYVCLGAAREAAARFGPNASAAAYPIYEMLCADGSAQRRGLTLDRFRDMPAVEWTRLALGDLQHSPQKTAAASLATGPVLQRSSARRRNQ